MSEAVTLASLITDVTAIMTAIFSWVGTVMTTITSQPLLLLMVCLSIPLIAVGVVRRLMNI